MRGNFGRPGTLGIQEYSGPKIVWWRQTFANPEVAISMRFCAANTVCCHTREQLDDMIAEMVQTYKPELSILGPGGEVVKVAIDKVMDPTIPSPCTVCGENRAVLIALPRKKKTGFRPRRVCNECYKVGYEYALGKHMKRIADKERPNKVRLARTAPAPFQGDKEPLLEGLAFGSTTRAFYYQVKIDEMNLLMTSADFGVERPMYIAETGTFVLPMNGDVVMCSGCRDDEEFCKLSIRCNYSPTKGPTCPYKAAVYVEVTRKNSATDSAIVPMCRFCLTKQCSVTL